MLRIRSSWSLNRMSENSGVPRPLPGWQITQLTLLKMGPSPSSGTNSRSNASLPRSNVCCISVERPSNGVSKFSFVGVASGALGMAARPHAVIPSAPTSNTKGAILIFIYSISVRWDEHEQLDRA